MDCLNEKLELELERFIEKHNIAPTLEEKLLLKLAILHGVIVYNEHLIRRTKNGC